jgi:preprotein translocase subunit YajC
VIDLAYAMGPAPQSGGGIAAVLPQLVPIVLVLGIFFFLVIRPQQRERRNRSRCSPPSRRATGSSRRAG